MSVASRPNSLARAASTAEIISRARAAAEGLAPDAPLRFFAVRDGHATEIEPPAEEAPAALLALAARAPSEILGAGYVVLAVGVAGVSSVAMPVSLAATAAAGLLYDAIVLALRSQRDGAAPAATLDTFDALDSTDLGAFAESLASIVGSSLAMRRPLALLARVAPSDVPVLFTGESGTGKEVFARALHQASTRARGPFVALNCAAIPEGLFEAELFGYRRGAFSGAVRDHGGLARQAHGGTLLLDEVGELSLDGQAKLLRFLEDRRVQSLGDHRLDEVDARILSATNRDLAEEVSASRFREDLFYRLNVVEIALPPLRQRRDDIGVLARHLVARHGADAAQLSPQALALLERYLWPGNVRELDNELRRALALAAGGAIEPRHLSRKIRASQPPPSDLVARVRSFKRDLVAEALKACDGNQSAAARQLGISRQHLRQLMTKLDIDR